MPRTARSLVAALFLAGALVGASLTVPVSAAPVVSQTAATSPDQEAQDALARAVEVFSSPAASRPTAESRAKAPDATLALRDLFTVLPRLQGRDRETAQGLLARPSEGGGDPQDNGYTTESRRTCSKKVCVHYVTSTSDAPPSLAWVRKNLQILQEVYNFEVGRLGYRAPAREPNVQGTGGDARFDVYLKNIGLGIYGYCAPEYRAPGTSSVASGYCVLDNDFASAEFGGADPLTSLRVTAAHEFFHAIQFAYDFLEDPWLLESTATWMEERYADNADDNLQYLKRSQLQLPGMPLDLFEKNGSYHYGQWAFWEFLSETYGNGIVKSVITRAAEPRSGRNFHSTQALSAALKNRGGLAKNFAAYASANTLPARNYTEGRKWPASPLAASRTLTKGKSSLRRVFTVDHLASSSVGLKPSKSLRGNKWKLRVSVKGPHRASSPAAFITVVTKRRGLRRISVPLNKSGAGKARVPFAAADVKRVFVTVANASTRTRCGSGTTLACEGQPRDDNRRFALKVSAYK